MDAAAPSLDPALQHLIDQVRQAHDEGTALEIRGGATKAFYGNPPTGQCLDTRGLQGILQYEPSELVVRVRAGTSLAELEAVLEPHGQCLPFEPPRLGPPGTATVGGMVATALAGPARAAVGGVRDYVLGTSVINGRGQWLHFGGQVMKNVAGYDVSRLMVGAMGILGVLSDVSIKVLPRAVATATLRFESDEAQALERMNEWAGQPLPVHATAWWNGTLVVRLSGAQAAVQTAAGLMSQRGGELVDPSLAHTFWQGLRDQSDEYFVSAQSAVAQGARLWRLSVPDTTGPLPLEGDTLIEWSGAQRWLCTPADPEEVRAVAQHYGGHATVYRAAQLTSVSMSDPTSDPTSTVRPQAFSPLSPPLMRLHRQLKAAFDPKGIFNPGRLYPDL